jgi:hypothetical protein
MTDTTVISDAERAHRPRRTRSAPRPPRPWPGTESAR